MVAGSAALVCSPDKRAFFSMSAMAGKEYGLRTRESRNEKGLVDLENAFDCNTMTGA
jgi:hypothetical protein